jgi:hypothetical protein
MVQVVESSNDWADAFRKIGGGVSQGYTQRSDENAVQKAVSDLGPNASARDILNALTNTKTYSPEAKQKALQNYMGVEKFEEAKKEAASKQQERQVQAVREAAEKQKKETTERANVKSIVSQLESISPEQKEEFGNTLSQKTAEEMLKNEWKAKTAGQKPDDFDKRLQTAQADEYVKLSDYIPKLDSTLGDIAYVRQLSDNFGVGGRLANMVGLSKDAAEMESVAFTLIDPIVKIFNPSGPIAQQKLKTIQDKYAIKATDFQAVRDAKLNALERFAKQAKARAQQKMDLIKKYKGLVPKEESDRFDKESETIADVMIDYDLVGEEVKAERPPLDSFRKG